jgi:predicted nucleic acid-binding protein
VPVLDTNVLVRYLSDDNVDLSPRALRLLDRIEDGELAVYLPESVFVEIVQVMMSPTYNTSRETVRERLRPILAMPGIEMPSKRTYGLALDIFVDYTRLSIVDAICAAHAQRFDDQTVITFDRGFRNIPGVVREEP